MLQHLMVGILYTVCASTQDVTHPGQIFFRFSTAALSKVK